MLFAARDRFGIKPLFYAEHQGTLYLASEVKALFAAGVPARWDREAISRGASGGGHPTQTLFEGVFQVPPGHYLLATRRRHARPPLLGLRLSARRRTSRARARTIENAERLREALDEAVRLRLRADVPVGCYLSGGLDSCSVLGLASRHLSTPIRAFTLTFDQPDYDESAIARGDGRACGRRVLPGADPAGRSGRPLRRRDLARGDAVLQRARRREVRAEPRGARRRLQGRADRRRLRRDLRRLSALPARHAALRQRRPGSGGR